MRNSLALHSITDRLRAHPSRENVYALGKYYTLVVYFGGHHTPRPSSAGKNNGFPGPIGGVEGRQTQSPQG